MEAIISATRWPAEFFGMQDSLGTIEEGKIADLILLDASPLENIGNTQRINAVVMRGKLIPKSELRAMLVSSEAAAKKK
jgi:imidazolonepropionase-like amidohydrolase